MERIYLDTSVFGGYFEPEFELWTKVLFDRISKGKFKILISRLTDIELENAPQKVQDLANTLPKENVTLNYADVLVSWNFKHIVNHLRIRGYNAVNFKYGHKILDIRSPREILEYEN